MADVSLDIQKELLDTMEKINSTLYQTNDLLNTNKKINTSLEKTQDKMLDNYDDIQKHQKEYNKQLGFTSSLMKGVLEIANKMKNFFLGLFSVTTLLAFTKNLLEINQNLRETAFRMGLGAKGLNQLQSATQGVVMATGMAAKESSELVMALTRITGKNKDIETLSITAGQFAKVTGVGADEAAQLTGNLSRMGGLGTSSIKSVVTTMAILQRTVGFTEGEMGELTRTTVKTTMLLKQMGKSAGDIEKFSKGTAVLAGAFRSVGIAADEALKIVEDLLDPTKVEDNAFLYSKLGISLSDAFAGNVDPGQLAGKFKELGSQLKSMNPAAAGAMAKELGMSLSTLRQFETIDMDKFGVAMKEAGGDYQKALASMQEEQTGPFERLKQMVNKFSVPLMKIVNSLERIIGPIINSLANFLEKGLKGVNPLIDKITAFVETALRPIIKLLANPATWLIIGLAILGIFILLKTKAKLFAKDLGESIAEGVRGGLEMGHTKGNAIAEEKGKKAGRALKEDYNRRIVETFEFRDKQEEASFARSQANTATHFKGILAWSARMQEGAAFGIKPQSRLIELADAYNKKAKERYDLQLSDNKQLLEERRGRINILDKEKEIITSRITELRNAEKLTAAQEIELKNLQKKDTLLAKTTEKVNKELITIQANGDRASDALLKTLSPDALSSMSNELEIEKLRTEETLKATTERFKQNTLEEQMRKNAVSMLQEQKNILDEKRLSGEATYEELTRAKEIELALQEQTSLESKLKMEAETLTAERAEQEDLLKNIVNQQKQISGIKPLGDTKAIKESQGFLTKLLNAGKAFGSNIEGALTKSVNSLGTGLKNAATNFMKGIQAAPGYLKALGGGGMIKGVGAFLSGKRIEEGGEITQKEKNGKGGIAALGGGIGMLIGFLMRLEPVQKMIAQLMETLKPALNSIGDMLAPLLKDLSPIFTVVGNVLKQLMKAIMPLITTLINAIMPIFMALLPPLLNIVKALLPAIQPIIDLLINVLMKFVLPMVLKLLGAILLILGYIFKGIGALVLLFDKKNPIGLAVKNLGDSLISQGEALWKGEQQNNEELLTATEGTTSAIKATGEDKPEVLRATGMQGKEFIKEQAASISAEETTASNAEQQTKIQQDMAKTSEKQSQVAEISAKASTETVALLREIAGYLRSQNAGSEFIGEKA